MVEVTTTETIELPKIEPGFYHGRISAVRDTSPKGTKLHGLYGDWYAVEVQLDGQTVKKPDGSTAPLQLMYPVSAKFNGRSKLGLLYMELVGPLPKPGENIQIDTALVGKRVKCLVKDRKRMQTFQGVQQEQIVSVINEMTRGEETAAATSGGRRK